MQAGMERKSKVVEPPEGEACSVGKKQELELLGDVREVEAHVRQLLEALPGMIGNAPPDDRFEYVNDRPVEIAGVQSIESVARRWIGSPHPEDAKRAFRESVREGAAGLPLKYCLIVLSSYLTTLISRRGWDNAGQQRVRSEGQPSDERLSARECAVLALIARGQSNKRVAQTLRIAPETVKSHVKRTFLKLGSKTRAEAVARATELGFLGNLVALPNAPYGITPSVRGASASASTVRSYLEGNSSHEESETSLIGAV
jgi:DNA-binding CsgD family transcriptional regulator